MKNKLGATQKNKLVCKIGKATKLTLGNGKEKWEGLRHYYMTGA